MFRITSTLLVILLNLAFPAIALSGMVELKAGENGHFLTRAAVNGTSVAFMVDTGSSTVALNQSDARRAGFLLESLDFDTDVSTANGMVKAARIRIDRIEIGGIRMEDVDAVVMPKNALSGSLLGMSFLSRLRSFEVREGTLYLRD